jgi:hypothetical protein
MILNSIIFDFSDYGTRSGNMNFADNVRLLESEGGDVPDDNNTNKSGALF